MGHSITTHCIGLGKPKDNQRKMYYAMNRLEIMQQTIIAKNRDDETITDWYAQTKTGKRILGEQCFDVFVPQGYNVSTKDIPQANSVITCTACEGTGCHICNYSGITQQRIINQYQDWQIERIKEEKINMEV